LAEAAARKLLRDKRGKHGAGWATGATHAFKAD